MVPVCLKKRTILKKSCQVHKLSCQVFFDMLTIVYGIQGDRMTELLGDENEQNSDNSLNSPECSSTR